MNDQTPNPHTLLYRARELYREQFALWICACSPQTEAEALEAMKKIKREAIDPLTAIINGHPAAHRAPQDILFHQPKQSV